MLLLFLEAFHSLNNGRILFNFWLLCAKRIVGDRIDSKVAHILIHFDDFNFFKVLAQLIAPSLASPVTNDF